MCLVSFILGLFLFDLFDHFCVAAPDGFVFEKINFTFYFCGFVTVSRFSLPVSLVTVAVLCIF